MSVSTTAGDSALVIDMTDIADIQSLAQRDPFGNLIIEYRGGNVCTKLYSFILLKFKSSIPQHSELPKLLTKQSKVQFQVLW